MKPSLSAALRLETTLETTLVDETTLETRLDSAWLMTRTTTPCARDHCRGGADGLAGVAAGSAALQTGVAVVKDAPKQARPSSGRARFPQRRRVAKRCRLERPDDPLSSRGASNGRATQQKLRKAP